MPIDAGSYLAAFSILLRDLERATEHVEPTDANLSTYSHRLYELLLRACTEFESVCKDALNDRGSTKDPTKMTVPDYVTLDASLGLERCEVGIMFWRPSPAYVKPFDGWTTKKPALPWYAAYNTVKHNRATEFTAATLANVRLAVAALFALFDALVVIDQSKQVGVTQRIAPSGGYERVFTGYPFTIIA